VVSPLSNQETRFSWLGFAAGLVVLDASLSFSSLWPTPGIRWTGQLSVECAVLLAGLALAWHLRGRPPAWVLRLLAVVWTVLALGRYAAVTSTALFGRDINLYWDSRHFSAVGAMLARVASPLELAGVALAIVGILVAVYRAAALGTRPGEPGAGARRPHGGRWPVRARGRRALHRRAADDAARRDADHAVADLVHLRAAGGMVADILLGRDGQSLGEGPALPTDLSAIGGADVLVVFVESYGAVTYDRPAFAQALESRRVRFEEQTHASGLDVVSGFVVSPTFGGSSWLAHVSFLTGVEVKDESTNVR
jgi:hypothetical protein